MQIQITDSELKIDTKSSKKAYFDHEEEWKT